MWSQPRRSTSNGFIRTSAAGNGQLALCWSIAWEIASRFFASGEAIPRIGSAQLVRAPDARASSPRAASIAKRANHDSGTSRRRAGL